MINHQDLNLKIKEQLLLKIILFIQGIKMMQFLQIGLIVLWMGSQDISMKIRNKLLYLLINIKQEKKE